MKEKMRILTLDNSFTFGGAINSLAHMVKALDRETVEVILVTGQPRPFVEEAFPGTTCYHYRPKLSWVDNGWYRRMTGFPPFGMRPLRRALNALRFLYWCLFVYLPEGVRYYRIGKRHGVHLVHLNNIFGSQIAGIVAAKLLGVPCVAHLRDFEEVDRVTRFLARLVDHHVAISGAIEANLLELGVKRSRISVVHDAIDLEAFVGAPPIDSLCAEFGIAPIAPRYGIFGRVIDWKGIKEFILAARKVKDAVPDAVAFIVGGASDGTAAFYQEMQDLVRRLGLEKDVVFTGYRQDIPALMGFMDVVVHASNRPEPFGMVLIEAMAMSRPVVATRAGGPLDIVEEGTTGKLVDMGDVAGLADAVIVLLRNRPLMEAMGKAARRRVEKHFHNGLYAGKMHDVFKECIAQGNGD
ncbi:glycosyltransferase family 4 protein [Geomonas edaphica]|uniref:glycosyltransferase family 4 protein n=1 Tax=Geomonas edaphica TaxID=2570226 RepID=UPI0010A80D41|nr:glycosyltransferase family 4 protein [Geomonas edaphica]